MSFFHEMRQNANIGQAKAEAQNAQRSAENVGEALKRMEKKVEGLVMINQALFSFLQEKHGFTHDDLIARVQSLAVSGKNTAVDCSECGRKVGKGAARCMYCGAEKKLESIFDSL